jgi:tyrosinase
MALELLINGSSKKEARYLSWAPSPCELRLTGLPLAIAGTAITVTNQSTAGGGQLVFYKQPGDPPQNSITLKAEGRSGVARFWAGGKFPQSSSADRDTSIVIAVGPARIKQLTVPVMVRVRKDANKLSRAERDRFVSALARLNNRGAGLFQTFREMHLDRTSSEAHGRSGFLPWHRAYLLDLERELQALDPSVSLPYWRFDAPAPNLFHHDFLGVSNASGVVGFSAGNPLFFWTTDTVPGVHRTPDFNTATMPATDASSGTVLSEGATLSLGRAGGSRYAGFRSPLEGNPHGRAHVSFGGSISSIDTAAKDPLFFLLHANIDRLWAKWQWMFKRFDPGDALSYSPGGRVGHELADDMWPWNGVMTAPRPSTAPGGAFRRSIATTAPSSPPLVREMLDYQGVISTRNRLGFDYDDVPYEA